MGNGTYSRLRKIATGNPKVKKYEVIRKNGIRYIKESELESISKVIREVFTEACKEGYEAQDILLNEGEKPEIRVKGRWQVLEQCEAWELKHFNYFLFNMSPISTKERDGNYYMGEEVVKEQEGKMVSKSEIEYAGTKVNIRSRQIMERYGNRFLDSNFFHDLMKEREGSYDYSLSYGNYILRCHVYSVYGTGERTQVAGLSIRLVPKRIPKLEELNLPEKVKDITKKKSGLFLVSGHTGDGKSTTVASIINKYNNDPSSRKVITIVEDPIEYIHKSQNARIVQRQLGENVPSYGRATDDSLRESSDIVVLGELKTKEEISNGLRLAEVGKLVIATIHSNSIPHTVDRFIGEFSNEQDQYRGRLLENLLGILHQNLVVFKGEQFPLSSLLFLEDEDSRQTLRQNGFRREVIEGLIEGEDEKTWAVSQQDWFNEKEKKAMEIQERLNNGEDYNNLKEHEQKLLLLLQENAREVLLGDYDIK